MYVPSAKRSSSKALATALCAASSFVSLSHAIAAPAEPVDNAGLQEAQALTDQKSGAPVEASNSDEIVVTAARREQRIQDVPIAISAIGAEAILERQVTQVSDILKLSPNSQVSYPYGEGGPPNFVIRGISSTDYSPNQSKPIAIYIDEGIRNLQAFESMPVFDVERVEVLRGPQGTLYGKNATGGAVNIVTIKPGFRSEGYLTGSYGNFDRVRFQGAVQSPLVDGVLSVRVAGLFVRDKGTFRNVAPGARDLNQTDVFAIRAALQFEPTDDFEATLRYNHVSSGGRNYAPIAANIDFDDPAILFPGNGFSTLPGSNRDGLDFFESSLTRTPERDILIDGFNLAMRWKATDTISINSVTTYDWGRWIDTVDSDGLELEVESPFVTRGRNLRQFLQEFRLATSFSGPLNVQAGAMYTHDNADAGFDFRLFTDPACGVACSAGLTPTGRGLLQTNDFLQKRDGYSAYARAELELARALTATGGVRFSRDKVAVNRYNAFLGDTADKFAVNTIANVSGRRTFNDTSFEVGVNWKPVDELLLYASMREGYRTGAVNAQAFTDPSEVNFAPPETARTYEFGFKSTLLDRALTVNGSVFQTDYENQQVIVPEGLLLPLRSISEARVRGFEGEITAKPTGRITLGLGVGVLDPQYGDDAIVTGSSGIDVSGNQIANSARFSLNLNSNVVLAELHDATIELNADGVYTSRVFYDIGEVLSQDGYWLANARLAYNADRFSVGAGVKNLFNEKYVSYGLQLRALGFDFLQRGVPRMYSADVTFRF